MFKVGDVIKLKPERLHHAWDQLRGVAFVVVNPFPHNKLMMERMDGKKFDSGMYRLALFGKIFELDPFLTEMRKAALDEQ